MFVREVEDEKVLVASGMLPRTYTQSTATANTRMARCCAVPARMETSLVMYEAPSISTVGKSANTCFVTVGWKIIAATTHACDAQRAGACPRKPPSLPAPSPPPPPRHPRHAPAAATSSSRASGALTSSASSVTSCRWNSDSPPRMHTSGVACDTCAPTAAVVPTMIVCSACDHLSFTTESTWRSEERQRVEALVACK